MPLTIIRPLVFFDIESTGTDTAKDRIIDLSLLKIYPDETREIKNYRCNPGIPIPPGSTAIHGITDADVIDSPLFESIAHELLQFISGCDFGGYNIKRFDVPMIDDTAGADIFIALPCDGYIAGAHGTANEAEDKLKELLLSFDYENQLSV